MDKDQGRGGPQMNREAADRTSGEVRDEIEQARAELGDTVEALAAKTDVKEQAKQAVTDAKATVAGKAADVKQTVTGKKDEVTAAVQETTPQSVGEARRHALALIQDNRPMMIAAGTFVLGLLIGSRRGR
jgi:CHASE3 domain sensor protein